MSQNSSLDYVPDATQGEADSVAAPGSAGVGGTYRELTDAELASVLKSAIRVVELRAVHRAVGVEEFKRLGLSIDLRIAERLVLIDADWLLEQGE